MTIPAQRRRVRLSAAAEHAVHPLLQRIRTEQRVPGPFSEAAIAEAERAAAEGSDAGLDLTDVPFLTIDPPGARDLDQAMHLSRAEHGYLVQYAIADPASFVRPGGALDAELADRGVTFYGPDGSIALHPQVLSEEAASLLAGRRRPACVWQIRLDGDGALVEAQVHRAQVRSRAQLDYREADRRIASAGGAPADELDQVLVLLREIGQLRLAQERARGGASLAIREQEVVATEGGYRLVQRAQLDVEEWNAQISLLTGIAAAGLMRTAGVGILRTLPPADPEDVARVRRAARGLGIEWPQGRPYGEVLSGLDSAVPAHAAFLQEATSLFRGAGYVTFDSTGDAETGTPPPSPHSAIAAEYAHVTAPLRRLVDRYGLEICLAASAGTVVPEWVREALPDLPGVMGRAAQRSSAYERACVNAVEAVLLQGRVGQVFEGVIVAVDAPDGDASDGAASDGPEGSAGAQVQRGTVVLTEPAVRAEVTGAGLPLGELVRVRVSEVDVESRRVRFSLA
ncbi:RNB domain-containing ribonuclease [Ruania suaedae]|uniref:RNB domain-containing ribonuclease n=1 Tax=Ruania suaedae TaxID=2897774 RepID=UPI001E380602|nr:RNB domain-containing ribonuclease [Ruania suaedae]UFU02633.1 RNB domain-containing ribonuclease [Ruania suaedae]